MEYTITVKCEDEFERIAIVNAVKNKRKLDEIYDEVFRPVIKYGDNEDLATSYVTVWEKLSEYLNE